MLVSEIVGAGLGGGVRGNLGAVVPAGQTRQIVDSRSWLGACCPIVSGGPHELTCANLCCIFG